MRLYGIKNCNSVKKVINILNKKGIEFDFSDIKKINEDILNLWLKQKSFYDLINTVGITAKKLGLSKEKIANLSNSELKKIVLENPSCIKRPVIEKDGKIYTSKDYEEIL